MPDDIKIINSRPEHRDYIETACKQTYIEHNARQPFAFPKNSHEMLLETSLSRAFETANGVAVAECPSILIALYDDQVAGYLILSEWSKIDPLSMPYVNIDDIFVSAEYRGRGIGDALIGHAQKRADERDWGNLTATVWAGNDYSDALFRRNGFAVQSTTYRHGSQHQAIDYPTEKPVGTRFVNTLSLMVLYALPVLVYFLYFRKEVSGYRSSTC